MENQNKETHHIPLEEYGVHISHCCKWHECKYGEEGCPVVLRLVEQKYLCEDCYEDINDKEYYEKKLQDINEIEEFSRAKKEVVKFGDVLYRPCLSYAGKANFINTEIVREILTIDNYDYIITFDVFGQRWTESLNNLDETIFRNKENALENLHEKMKKIEEEKYEGIF